MNSPKYSTMNSQKIEIKDAPISQVLVMEDRAQVTRIIKRKFVAGSQSIVIDEISPLLVDRSLRIRFVNKNGTAEIDSGNLVLDFRLDRQIRIGSNQSEEYENINEKILHLAKVYSNGCAKVNVLHSSQTAARKSTRVFTQYAREQAKFKKFDKKWGSELNKLDDFISKADDEIFKVQWVQDDIILDLDRLFQQQAESTQPTRNHILTLECDLSVENAGDYTIEIDYQVPCALWRPQYRAELIGEENSEKAEIKWQSLGCVWQRSGEDWNDVNLSFSTARPTLGAELSYLEEDRLSLREKTKEEVKTIEVESHDDDINVTSTGSDPVTAETPPGVDDGGETRTFRVDKPVTIPSDGNPHSFVFDRWSNEAEANLVCTPELDTMVFLESKQTNGSKSPLLAGPVALSRRGTFTGRSSVKFVAAGESFTLGWGSEDELTVLRQQHNHSTETKILHHKEHHFEIQLFFSNRSPREQKIKVRERIPISEIAKVEIDIDDSSTSKNFSKDEHGILTWDLPIQSEKDDTIQLHYKVSMPKNINWSY